MTEAELDEIEERANAATIGLWTGYVGLDDPCYVRRSDGSILANDIESLYDARFIAHARMDVPALIAEVRRLREELKSSQETVEAWADDYQKQSWELNKTKRELSELKTSLSKP